MKTMGLLALAIGLSLSATPGWAGEVRVLDSSGALTEKQVKEMQGSTQWSFDASVLFRNAPSVADLRMSTEQALSRNVLAVGIDPTRGKVVVRYSPSLGIPEGHEKELAQTAIPYLNSKRWVDGIHAIGDRAALLSTVVRTVDPGLNTRAAEHETFHPRDPGRPVLWFLLLSALSITIVVLVVRRVRRGWAQGDPNDRPPHVLYARPMPPPSYSQLDPGTPASLQGRPCPVPGAPAGTTIINNGPQGGSSAADMLVGLEVGRLLGGMGNGGANGTTVIHEREVVRETRAPIQDDVATFTPSIPVGPQGDDIPDASFDVRFTDDGADSTPGVDDGADASFGGGFSSGDDD